ncbi:hypothetical protein K443DRAFT_244691 [Laccaria amethystina LaAM-08-1]|jgi:hypothetical protein|uniref:Uncharacterized protein n=1 Tax=Laccaria amethystina LaAM-08-1 TaxID=1095629 RepID=A0A0C9WXC5_9AGAR|nr:hypothetical protein K443DRAFT_244691 [Laccaria amethystina LaAM-08-1]
MKNVKTYKQKILESHQRLDGEAMTVFPRQNIADALRVPASKFTVKKIKIYHIEGITISSFRTCLSSAFLVKTSFTVYLHQSYFSLMFSNAKVMAQCGYMGLS